MLKRANVSTQHREYVESILSSGQHLLHVVNECFMVQEAGDHGEAWKGLVYGHPDIVVLDLDARVNPAQLVSRLRSRSELESMPIVALGSRVPDCLARLGLRSGQDVFLSKPIGGEDLLKTMADAGRWAIQEGSIVEACSASITEIPDRLRARLTAAALSADLDAILELARELRETDPRSAGFLDRAAHAMDYESILEAMA